MQAQAALHDFCGFSRANQWAGEDHVERDVQLPQGVREGFGPLNAFGRERSVSVVLVSWVAMIHGFAVSQDVEFHA
jgi:hypothetical protein